MACVGVKALASEDSSSAVAPFDIDAFSEELQRRGRPRRAALMNKASRIQMVEVRLQHLAIHIARACGS